MSIEIKKSFEKPICWICCRESGTKLTNSSQFKVCVSLLPKNFASHHDKDIEELWTNADKYYSNNFQNQLCSYLCWDCAH